MTSASAPAARAPVAILLDAPQADGPADDAPRDVPVALPAGATAVATPARVAAPSAEHPRDASPTSSRESSDSSESARLLRSADPSLTLLALALAQRAVDVKDAGDAAREAHRQSMDASSDAASARRASARATRRAERAAQPRRRWVRRLVRALSVIAGVAAAVCTGGVGAIATAAAAAAALAQAGRGVASSVFGHQARRAAGAAESAGLTQKRAQADFQRSTDRLGEAQAAARRALSTHGEIHRRRSELELQLIRTQPH